MVEVFPIGTRQYGRRVILRAGRPGSIGFEISGLRMSFEIKRDGKPKPDRATITIYNPNLDTISALEEEDISVFLRAGYGDRPPEVFSGSAVDELEVKYDRKDRVVTIKATDGGAEYRGAVLSESWVGPIGSLELIRRIADTLGLGVGYLDEELEDVPYNQGFVHAGAARDALDKVVATSGGEWTIQDGELIVSLIGKATAHQAVLLSRNSGLIGSPEKTKRGVKIKSLLNGRLLPGRVVQVKALQYSGWYKIQTSTMRGDSGFSGEFYTEMETKFVGEIGQI